MPHDASEESVQFAVEGMHCSSCGILVDEALEELDGVVSSSTSVRRGRVVVQFDPSRTSPRELAAAIVDLGYRVRLIDDEKRKAH